MAKTAIILGATGLTGSHVLQLLLNDHRYDRVKLFSRSSVNRNHPKLEEHLVDLFDFNSFQKDFTGHEIFCCIGTTKSKTPDEETYKNIDYGIPVDAAKFGKINNIGKFLVVSALGAKAGSSFSYVRLKGEMERDVMSQNITDTYFFKPSLIAGDREENRPGEKIGKVLLGFINPLMIGSLRKYRSISPSTIARAMMKVANEGYRESNINSAEIKELAGEK